MILMWLLLRELYNDSMIQLLGLICTDLAQTSCEQHTELSCMHAHSCSDMKPDNKIASV